MKYQYFLFDLDDTLFDFSASENLSFRKTLEQFEIAGQHEQIYLSYKSESRKLWKLLEEGKIEKDFLKVERFRRTFEAHGISCCPEKVGERYLENLPQTVHLNKYALEICEEIASKAKIGIITNGIETVQKRRLSVSGLEPFIQFTVVSEECGYAKPHIEFFKKTLSKIENTDPSRILVIGDRIETDILGAQRFGLDSCWFNPTKGRSGQLASPTYEIRCLSDLRQFF